MPGFKNLIKSGSGAFVQKGELSRINLLNGENIFTEMKQLFNQSEIISLRTQDIYIKIPWIYNEDLEAYKNHLLIWKDTQAATIKARESTIKSILNTC